MDRFWLFCMTQSCNKIKQITDDPEKEFLFLFFKKNIFSCLMLFQKQNFLRKLVTSHETRILDLMKIFDIFILIIKTSE